MRDASASSKCGEASTPKKCSYVSEPTKCGMQHLHPTSVGMHAYLVHVFGLADGSFHAAPHGLEDVEGRVPQELLRVQRTSGAPLK